MRDANKVCMDFPGCVKALEDGRKNRKPCDKALVPCKNLDDACVSVYDEQSIISCRESGTGEKGAVYQLDLRNCPTETIAVCMKIDGGVVKGTAEQRCDYAIFTQDYDNSETIKRSIFVELKGQHIKKAYEQLMNTLQLDSVKSAATGRLVYCRIVHTKVPASTLNSPTVLKLEQTLKKRGVDVKKLRSGNSSENYADLCRTQMNQTNPMNPMKRKKRNQEKT